MRVNKYSNKGQIKISSIFSGRFRFIKQRSNLSSLPSLYRLATLQSSMCNLVQLIATLEEEPNQGNKLKIFSKFHLSILKFSSSIDIQMMKNE